MSDICALCRQTARQPIRQSCSHVLCFECGCAIKRKEIDQGFNQAQFKINCPLCSQTVVFFDINQLVIQEKSNSFSNMQKSPIDIPFNSFTTNLKHISEYSKYKNPKQSTAIDCFSREDPANWFEPSFPQDYRTSDNPHSQEERLDSKCRQQNATPICNETTHEQKLERSPKQPNCSRINEVTECVVSCEANNNLETNKEKSNNFANCNASPIFNRTESNHGISQERNSERNCQLLAKQENQECEQEDKIKQREFVQDKYSYFTHEEIGSKIERLQKGLEKGIPLKCEQHGEFSTLYDTATHDLKCPMCVFEEDCLIRSQISEGSKQSENLCFPQYSGFSRVAPAKVCQESMKKDIHDWEFYLEKKMCEIEKIIQNAVLNQGLLRENYVEETRLLKSSFEELRLRLQTREIELSECLSKRYAEENEHLKRVSEELQPIRDKLRLSLRHFQKNLSLEEQMNLCYQHEQLNQIRKIVCQIKRKKMQLYEKCSSQILSLDLKEELSSYLGIFGRVDSFVLKGYENQYSENPCQAIKTRSAGHSIDRNEGKCLIGSVNQNNGLDQKNQQSQLKMQIKCLESNCLKQSAISKSDYNKQPPDERHSIKVQTNDCESQIIQTPCSITPRNSCKQYEINGPVQGFCSLPPCKMEQKCSNNLDFCGNAKSPVSYVSKQDFSSNSLPYKESVHKNSFVSSEIKTRIDKNEECQNKQQVQSQWG